jgi:uncharacterized membrane protein YadS
MALSAIAAIAIRRSYKELSAAGIKPIVLRMGETFFLAVVVLLLLSVA